ncbi:MAG: hypothetical protein KDE04_20010 [Anaerolineales bacterium]|nr:hypothetical protein [Anaerolineales bacterium]
MTDSLNTPAQSAPQRVRIHSHVTQSRFLHVEDALGIGKIRLFAGNYRRGQGMDSHAYHFIDLADARVIFAALARGEPGFSYREYKGTPPQNGQALSPDSAVSRVLSVAVKGDNVYVELKSGPGKLTPTGAITPNGKPQVEVNVGFKQYEAQRLAATVLAYIHAWDIHRIMVHQQLVGQPAPYLLTATEAVATEAVGVGTLTTVGSESLAEAPAAGPHASTGNGNRPVTRKAPLLKANGSQVAVPAQPAVSPAVVATAEAIYGPGGLRYGDGTAVDAGNLAEVQAFQRFAAEKQGAPASRAILQAYYREHMAA